MLGNYPECVDILLREGAQSSLTDSSGRLKNTILIGFFFCKKLESPHNDHLTSYLKLTERFGRKKWEKISFRGGGGSNFPFFAFSANLIGFFFCKKLESICIDHLTSHPTPPDCFRGKLPEKKFPITWEKSKNQKNLKKSGFWLENAQNHACHPQFFDKFIPVVYLRYSNVFQVDRKLCFLSRPSGVRRGQNSRFSSQLQND